MGFSLESGVPAITVFLQGILSFFSPCVLPLIPLYIGYLSGGTKTVDENGLIHYKKDKVIINTLFFIIGVSFAFFILGFGFTAARKFFVGNKMIFSRIGGIIVILLGLYQLGVFGWSMMISRERRIPMKINNLAMNPIVALLVGFTFSFAWTPCVGPALASVLIMASSANSSAQGFMLIGIYTLGFVIPFMVVGLFTGTVLGFFKKHTQILKYSVKIGAILMILMGVMMITGWMNGITSYLSRFSDNNNSQNSTKTEVTEDININETYTQEQTESETKQKEKEQIQALDFTLTDQYGNEHTLSDYKGKVVFLNFWATWCGPCQTEMPDIEELYRKYNKNEDDIIILGIANPKTDKYPNNSDVSEEEIKKFLSDNNYTYPVVMDTTGEIFYQYGISAFPTTFMIDKEGSIFGYVQGMLTKDMMESIIKQTVEGKYAQ